MPRPWWHWSDILTVRCRGIKSSRPLWATQLNPVSKEKERWQEKGPELGKEPRMILGTRRVISGILNKDQWVNKINFASFLFQSVRIHWCPSGSLHIPLCAPYPAHTDHGLPSMNWLRNWNVLSSATAWLSLRCPLHWAFRQGRVIASISPSPFSWRSPETSTEDTGETV